MRPTISTAVIALVALSVQSAPRRPADPSPSHSSSAEQLAELPASLAHYYPPTTSSPVYLERMVGLAFAFSGLVADLLEKDSANLQRGFESFRSQYVELARLVPEWESRFPMEPVEALGAALAADDDGSRMDAVGKIGRLCHECHLNSMVPVQQAHRWKRFAEITCEDRDTGGRVSHTQLMRDLDLAMAGIAADAVQGQAPQAQAYFRMFRKRFDQLEQSCLACHPGKREYYVDASIRSQVEKLGSTLEQPTIDTQRVMTLLQDIGAKSCGRCHLVHMPAAAAQAAAGH